MEFSVGLIVMVMFSSIVGIGIGNILMTFSGLLTRFGDATRGRVATAWLFVLLLTFLDMFWNSALLLTREEWSFLLFLYVIAGPIVLLFAATLMSTLLNLDEAAAAAGLEQRIMSRFFWMFAAGQAWVIGIDYLLGTGWTLLTSVSAALLAAAVTLAVLQRADLRRAFTVVMLILTVANAVLQGV